MFRFTIRDLLWLALAVGLTAAWYASDRAWRMRYVAAQREYMEHLNKAEERVFKARAEVYRLENGITVEEAYGVPLKVPARP